MNFSDHRPARAGFWGVLLLGVFAWAPAAYPGYWQGLEGFTPIYNAIHPQQIAGVAADADVWRGAGAASFILVQPFLLLGLAPTAAVRAVFIIALILGGLGVYTWLLPRLGDRAAGLAGLIYMLLPPVLATVYVRGSLSDALILALLPMTLAAIAAYAESESLAAAGIAVIAMIWMWRTQAGLALLASVMLLLYALLVERHRWAALVVAGGGAAGLASLIPLWSIRAGPAETFSDHFVYLFQLFGNGWETAPSIPGWQDRFPFQLGFAALAFSLVTLWFWLRMSDRGRRMDARRLLIFSFIAAPVIIALSLTVSAPLWRIPGASGLLTYPWQIILVGAPLLAASAGALPAVSQPLAKTPYWPVLMGLAILASYPYLSADFTQVQPPERPYAVLGESSDIVLLEADLQENANPPATELTVMWQIRHLLDTDYNIFFQALAQVDGEWQVVAQLDAQPLGDERPATSWRPGEILTNAYRLDLTDAAESMDLENTRLRYYFGYYDWQTGERLPVDGGIDDKLVFYGR
jgi:hypothetical protein